MYSENRLQTGTPHCVRKKSASCTNLLINSLPILHPMGGSVLVMFHLILAITQPLI